VPPDRRGGAAGGGEEDGGGEGGEEDGDGDGGGLPFDLAELEAEVRLADPRLFGGADGAAAAAPGGGGGVEVDASEVARALGRAYFGRVVAVNEVGGGPRAGRAGRSLAVGRGRGTGGREGQVAGPKGRASWSPLSALRRERPSHR
jgi:hypothetical protein